MITLFSCWAQSQIKKSFMTVWQCHSTTEGTGDHRGNSCRGDLQPRYANDAQLKLDHAQLFLLFFEFLCIRSFGSGFNWLGLVGAGAAIEVARLDIDEGFLAQLGQVSA